MRTFHLNADRCLRTNQQVPRYPSLSLRIPGWYSCCSHPALLARVAMETLTTTTNREHFEKLVEELRSLEARLREGGGPERQAREHKKGKLTARERIHQLFDDDSRFQEIGLLIAYDQYDGQAPAAGVVIGMGRVTGREAIVVANDATVKAGSWWPETVRKILRAQEIA